MNRRFLELLACPDCSGPLTPGAFTTDGDRLLCGELHCPACPRFFRVRNGIPRFVEEPGYAANFGWQWNRFHKLQRDSYNGTTLVRDTIFKRSGWRPEDLRGKRILECGCGSGNDTEILAAHAETLVSVDLSESVDSIPPELLNRENLLVLQADLRRLPFPPGRFDIVYCHRVIQHTPDPAAAFRAMARHVREGGVFFLHTYDTHWKSVLHFKYWVRWFARFLPHPVVFRMLCLTGPVLYPLVGALNRVALFRRPVRLLIPFENYGRALKRAGARLTWRERYQYSLLVTFDDLTPRYDHPSPPATVEGWFRNAGFSSVNLRARNPVIALGTREATNAASAVRI